MPKDLRDPSSDILSRNQTKALNFIVWSDENRCKVVYIMRGEIAVACLIYESVFAEQKIIAKRIRIIVRVDRAHPPISNMMFQLYGCLLYMSTTTKLAVVYVDHFAQFEGVLEK